MKQLTVILHAELLPVDCPLGSNFSTSFQVFHLHQEKQVVFKHRQVVTLPVLFLQQLTPSQNKEQQKWANWDYQMYVQSLQAHEDKKEAIMLRQSYTKLSKYIPTTWQMLYWRSHSTPLLCSVSKVNSISTWWKSTTVLCFFEGKGTCFDVLGKKNRSSTCKIMAGGTGTALIWREYGSH